MEFKDIKKVDCGNFLNRYDICYRTPDGGEKVYEMFSRDGGIDCADRLVHPRTDAVIMIVTDKAGERMLLIREFRLELNREIYGVPAGLIDPGETPEEAAVRELRGDGTGPGGDPGCDAAQLYRRGTFERKSRRCPRRRRGDHRPKQGNGRGDHRRLVYERGAAGAFEERNLRFLVPGVCLYVEQGV